MKTYSLVIVYDDKSDEVEFIEEEITEDYPNVMFKLDNDIEEFDDETLKRLFYSGVIIGES